MGYTYISRFETGDLCKFGKASTLAARQSTLRTGSSGKLELFDYVETEHALTGEQFLKQRWAARLHRYRSEIFRLTEDECRAAMSELRHYLDHELPAELAQKAELAELETADNDDTLIEADPDITAAHRRLVDIEAQLRRLAAEAEPLRRALMLAIGKNCGIAGVATFDKADSNRSFNTARFAAEYPELYAQFQKKVFDTTAFSKAHRDLAETFKETGKKRTFFLIQDLHA
ncbi:hypothetical protein ACL02S_23805 [Nocardia sp. 004]|uniref:hypothetical protein n=1 Tax=Nocardia sp. 004 TaxID=3385978 RepID=UPI0039A2E178